MFGADFQNTWGQYGQESLGQQGSYNSGFQDNLPTNHTAIGSGLAGLSPQEQELQGLTDYYTQLSGNREAAPNPWGIGQGITDNRQAGNFNTLTAYLGGTYWGSGNGTSPNGSGLNNIGEFGNKIFGTHEWDYDNLTADNLISALGPNAQQILGDARDWERRDITRQNQQGSLAKTLAGYAGTAIGAVTGNPLAGALGGGLFGGASGGIGGALSGAAGGYSAGGGLNPITSRIKNALGFGGNEAFTNGAGLGLTGADLYNPASLATNAVPNAGLNASASNLFNPASLASGWSPITGTNGGAYSPGQGFTNPNALGIGGSDLYNPESLGGLPQESFFDKIKNTVKDNVGVGDLMDMFGNRGGQGGEGSDAGFAGIAGGIGAGVQGFDQAPQGQQNNQSDYLVDDIMAGSSEDAPGGNMPQYASQKLQAGTGQRMPGYQTDPFGNALENQPQNSLA